MAWLKLPDAVLRDLQVRGFTNDEILVWLTMLCLASRETRHHRGMLLVNKRPAQAREIAAEARVADDVVTGTIAKALTWDLLVEGRVPETGEAAYEIANWDLMQIDRTAAVRDARHTRRRQLSRSVSSRRITR
jgi:hypothetical protein